MNDDFDTFCKCSDSESDWGNICNVMMYSTVSKNMNGCNNNFRDSSCMFSRILNLNRI